MNLFSYINIKLRVVVPIGIKVFYIDGISTTGLRKGHKNRSTFFV